MVTFKKILIPHLPEENFSSFSLILSAMTSASVRSGPAFLDKKASSNFSSSSSISSYNS